MRILHNLHCLHRKCKLKILNHTIILENVENNY